MVKRVIPVIYICIHNRILLRRGREGFIYRKDLEDILGRLYHLHKIERRIVIKDLVDKGVLKKENSRIFLINRKIVSS